MDFTPDPALEQAMDAANSALSVAAWEQNQLKIWRHTSAASVAARIAHHQAAVMESDASPLPPGVAQAIAQQAYSYAWQAAWQLGD